MQSQNKSRSLLIYRAIAHQSSQNRYSFTMLSQDGKTLTSQVQPPLSISTIAPFNLLLSSSCQRN